MVKIIPFLLILPLLFSCKSTHYTPKNYQAAQLTVGSSGSVTGTFKEFTLLSNGQFFVNKGVTGELKELQKIGTSETHRIFKKVEDLELGTLKFNHPGNISHYLILKKHSKTNVVRWGEPGISPPAGIDEFYKYLLSVFQQ